MVYGLLPHVIAPLPGPQSLSTFPAGNCASQCSCVLLSLVDTSWGLALEEEVLLCKIRDPYPYSVLLEKKLNKIFQVVLAVISNIMEFGNSLGSIYLKQMGKSNKPFILGFPFHE